MRVITAHTLFVNYAVTIVSKHEYGLFWQFYVLSLDMALLNLTQIA